LSGYSKLSHDRDMFSSPTGNNPAMVIDVFGLIDVT
jgi:hypothetical protein